MRFNGRTFVRDSNSIKKITGRLYGYCGTQMCAYRGGEWRVWLWLVNHPVYTIRPSRALASRFRINGREGRGEKNYSTRTGCNVREVIIEYRLEKKKRTAGTYVMKRELPTTIAPDSFFMRLFIKARIFSYFYFGSTCVPRIGAHVHINNARGGRTYKTNSPYEKYRYYTCT